MSGLSEATVGSEVDVLAVGFPTCALAKGMQPVGSLPVGASVDLLMDAVDVSLRTHETLLVVLPAWSAEPALSRIATVSALGETTRILTYASALPPLAGGVMATLTGQLAAHVTSPAELLGLLPALERELVVLAWLRSVTKLERPVPSMAQHLRSHMPGAAFAVVLNGSHSGVHTLAQSQPRPPLPTRDGPVGLLVADSESDLDWLRATCQAWLPEAAVQRIRPGQINADYWGTSKHAEAVVYPLDIERVLRTFRSRTGSTTSCRWCTEDIRSSPCPFCGSAQERSMRKGVRS